MTSRTVGGRQEAPRLRPVAATLRAYAADWRHFGQWCHEHGRQPFDGAEPLERIVGDYMAAIHKALAISTLQRYVGQVRPEANDPRSAHLVIGEDGHAAGMFGSKLMPISPHGLRPGSITNAYGNRDVNEHTRQKTLETMRGQVRCARFNRDSSAGNVGLLKPPTRVKPAPTIR